MEKLDTKICCRCKQEKPLSDFSINCRAKDGLRNQCKFCDAEYNRSPARKASRKKWLQTSPGGKSQKRASRKYLSKNPRKKAAKDAVYRAIKIGKLCPSVFCEECGLPADTIGHHKSYDRDKWLDVNWVCMPCHVEIHRLLKLQARDPL